MVEVGMLTKPEKVLGANTPGTIDQEQRMSLWWTWEAQEDQEAADFFCKKIVNVLGSVAHMVLSQLLNTKAATDSV